MKKTLIYTIILLCSLFISMTPATAKTFETKIIHEPNKVWNIEFNERILFNENLNNYIYIETDSGDRHPTSLEISDDAKTVMVHPKTPFVIGGSYSLIITEGVQSEKRKLLKEETSMSFKVQGEYIQSIQAILNPLVTNVVIQGTKDVANMKISVNGNSEIILHKRSNDQFTKGMLGLMNGDELHIRAYTEKGDLLEEQTYQITN